MPPPKRPKLGPTSAAQFLSERELNEMQRRHSPDGSMTSREASPHAHLQEKSEILHNLLHGKLQQVAAHASEGGSDVISVDSIERDADVNVASPSSSGASSPAPSDELDDEHIQVDDVTPQPTKADVKPSAPALAMPRSVTSSPHRERAAAPRMIESLMKRRKLDSLMVNSDADVIGRRSPLRDFRLSVARRDAVDVDRRTHQVADESRKTLAKQTSGSDANNSTSERNNKHKHNHFAKLPYEMFAKNSPLSAFPLPPAFPPILPPAMAAHPFMPTFRSSLPHPPLPLLGIAAYTAQLRDNLFRLQDPLARCQMSGCSDPSRRVNRSSSSQQAGAPTSGHEHREATASSASDVSHDSDRQSVSPASSHSLAPSK